MRLLYLNPSGTIGGAEMCLLDLLATVGRARPSWSRLVVLGADGPLRPAVEATGTRCEVLPLPQALARLGDAGASTPASLARLGLAAPAALTATLGMVAGLRRLLSRERPDLVQTNGMKAHVLGAWAAPRRLPVVWHLHDYSGSRALMSRLLRASVSERITGVGVSRSVTADARAILGPKPRLETIYNGVDLDRFAPGPGDGAELDRLAGLPDLAAGAVRVGLVATYARWKGHEVFLEAAARLPAATPARFYIVGGPIYASRGSQYRLDELTDRARALGLVDRVGFVPHQADPAAAMRALDVVVHASTRPEPYGRVIVEAMACGRSVVAMASGGSAELFDDGATALGCPPADPDALAAAIGRLIADADLRRDLGRAGRAAVVDRFDRERLSDAWIDLYERCFQATR